jgi:phosphatidylglycerophosphate synthase
MSLTVHYSERLYNVLLSLYPVGFRIRFSQEMLQLFRDCSHDALEKGEIAVLVAFWMRLARDLFISVLRERQRELVGPLDEDHPLMALVDALLIPTMVTAKLAVLGPILTLMVRGGYDMPGNQFIATSGFFSLAIGTLAVAASVVITRLRPTARLWVKLST